MLMATVAFFKFGTGRFALPVDSLYDKNMFTGRLLRSLRTYQGLVNTAGHQLPSSVRLTAAVTVSAPVEDKTQLWGIWMRMASCNGYEFPLLSTVCVAPLAMLRIRVNDEIPVAAGIA